MNSEMLIDPKEFQRFKDTYHNLTKTKVEKRGEVLFINYRLNKLNSINMKKILRKIYHQIRNNFGTHSSIFLAQFRIGKFLFSSTDSNFRWFYPSSNTRIHTDEWITLNMKQPMNRIFEKLHLPSEGSGQSDNFATSSANFISLSNLEIIVQHYPKF